MARNDTGTLFWSPSLLAPSPARIIYLDTFVWRGLANAASAPAKSGPFYADLLTECRKAVARRAAFFPVSAEFVVEANKYGNLRGRTAMAQIVGEIGHFQSLASRDAIQQYELEAGLTAILGTPKAALGPYLIVGRSLLHAFQEEMPLIWWDSTSGNSSLERNDVPSAETCREIDRAGGWLPFQIGLLRAGNASGEFTLRSECILRDEERIARHLNCETPRRKGARLRDVFMASELIQGTDEAALEKALENHGWELEEWLRATDKRTMTNLLRGMPSYEFSSELRTRYHGSSTIRLSQNHMHDIAFLSLAVPYCDAVFTDKKVRRAIQDARLDKKMNTRMLETPEDAVEFISALPGVAPSEESWRLPGGLDIPESDRSQLPNLGYYFDIWE